MEKRDKQILTSTRRDIPVYTRPNLSHCHQYSRVKPRGGASDTASISS